MEGIEAVVSSQNPTKEGAKNLTDGDRLTRWTAAKEERNASATVDFKMPVVISTLVFVEPWHPWNNKKQKITLQYKTGETWNTIVEATSKGIGGKENFKPVKG